MVTGSNEQVISVAKDLLARNFPLIFLIVVLPVGLVGFSLAGIGMMLLAAGGLTRFAGVALIFCGLASPWLGLAVARFGLRGPARKLVAAAQAKQQKAVGKATAALDGAPAFYNAGMGPQGGALALAPSRGLAVVIGNMQEPDPQLRTWTLRREDLGQAIAQAPPSASAGGTSTGIAAWRNAIAYQQVQLAHMGLRIRPADASVPELFIQLDAEVARRWERLLEQFRLGTLQEPSSSSVFPADA